MSEATVCDRCGYTGEKTRSVNDEFPVKIKMQKDLTKASQQQRFRSAVRRIMNIQTYDSHAFTENYHLCPDCATELKGFLTDPELVLDDPPTAELREGRQQLNKEGDTE